MVSSAAAAIAAAQEVGYPVVLKVASERISHKTDVGGVKVDLRNADEVGAAYRELVGRLRRQDPHLRVTVQKLVPGGREVILGMTRDPQFGPLLMFGLGGVFVEVMRDVAVRIHPLTDAAARGMIRQIRGFPLLAGARGEKAVDLRFLEEMLLRLSQLVADLEDDLSELDLNPFIVTADAGDSFVVDARITLRER
jgi:acetyltransferase